MSGGERARVLLLKLMLSQNNFLLLDEPTNHLDIDSCEALEQALQQYEGTLFIISHDRYFINKLASKIYTLTESGTVEYIGNYDDYSAQIKALEEMSRIRQTDSEKGMTTSCGRKRSGKTENPISSETCRRRN